MVANQPYEIINKQGQPFQIKLRGMIHNWMDFANDFESQITKAIESGTKDVHAEINSPGGAMFKASDIGNQIQRFEGVKSCTIGAMAASSGFTLIMYFDAEHTECHSNSMFMYHDPSVYLKIMHEADFDSNKKLYQDLRSNVVEMIAERTGQSIEEVSENMLKTTWLNATEAKKLGIVKRIKRQKAKAAKETKSFFVTNNIEIPELLNSAFDLPETEPQNKHSKTKMEKIAKKLGLPENASEAQIEAAITALEAKANFAVDALTTSAKAKGLPEETVKSIANNSFSDAVKLVNETTAPSGQESESNGDLTDDDDKPSETRIVDVLSKLVAGAANGQSPDAKNWDDYTPQELQDLEQKDPKAFKALHSKTFNN